MKLNTHEADILFARNITAHDRGRSGRVKAAVNRRKRRAEKMELRDHIGDVTDMMHRI